MSSARAAGVVVSLASAVASASCTSDHSCTTLYVFCDQTRVTLEAPGNAWPAGTYTLTLDVDGAEKQCTLQIPDPLQANSVQGTCSTADTALALEQVCPQPPAVCEGSVCTATASSANCLPGQYRMIAVISPTIGSDAQPRVAARVAVDIARDGTSLTSETIAPTVTTAEPNGAGCGTCTNASALVSISGG